MQGFWSMANHVIRRSDILLEVIDARMPDMTRNRNVEGKIRGKRKAFILVLNKSDLITRSMRDDFMRKTKSTTAVFVSCKKNKGIAELREMILDVSSRRRHNQRAGVGVIGYPNTGKSSVINALVGRSVAKTSPVAGMTRGVQWVSGGDDVMFLDTPGVMPMDDRTEADQAVMGAIDPDKLENPEMAAIRIIQLFKGSSMRNLERFYGIAAGTGDAAKTFMEICRRKNFLLRGGRLDEARTAMLVVRDWQRGKLLLDFAAR